MSSQEVALESELAVCIWKKYLPVGSIYELIKECRDKKAFCLQQRFAFFDTEYFSPAFVFYLETFFTQGEVSFFNQGLFLLFPPLT